jgi:hypothetical protein
MHGDRGPEPGQGDKHQRKCCETRELGILNAVHSQIKVERAAWTNVEAQAPCEAM